MKYLTKFNESKTEQKIHKLCKKYEIINFIINDDGSIDVNGDVDLSFKDLSKLPLKFNKVNGDFDCSDNELTNLKGCPKEVGGDFDCSDNELTNLEGCPKEVGGDFDCSDNELTNLEGCPKEISGCFYCDSNELTSLEGCPNEVGSYFICYRNPIYEIFLLFNDYKDFLKSLDYNYLRGTKINKIRFQRALEEQNLLSKLPNKLKYYEYI